MSKRRTALIAVVLTLVALAFLGGVLATAGRVVEANNAPRTTDSEWFLLEDGREVYCIQEGTLIAPSCDWANARMAD